MVLTDSVDVREQQLRDQGFYADYTGSFIAPVVDPPQNWLALALIVGGILLLARRASA